MMRQILTMVLEEVIEALAAEDSIEAAGYIERIRELLDEGQQAANLIPEEVRCT